jgi:tetratricopeptide (TPR) repeat protein
MKTLVKSALVAVIVAASAGCSRNNIEAVNLANEGDQSMKGGNTDEAISKFEQATQLDPTNHRILWKLALAYTKKEEWDKVGQTCALAEKQAPDFANYWYMHGHALLEQAKKGSVGWGEAKEPLQTAISRQAGRAVLLRSLRGPPQQPRLRGQCRADLEGGARVLQRQGEGPLQHALVAR